MNQTKFEALYRAAKAVDAAVAISTNLPRFRELVQNFATDISIAKDRSATTEERKAVELFADALATYFDSLQLWQAQLNDRKVDVGLPKIRCAPETAGIALRYDLECIPHYENRGILIIPAESIQYLWALAGVKLRRATAFYLADPTLADERDLGPMKTAIYKPLMEELARETAFRKEQLARETAFRNRIASHVHRCRPLSRCDGAGRIRMTFFRMWSTNLPRMKRPWRRRSFMPGTA